MVGLIPDLPRNGALMDRAMPLEAEQEKTVQYTKTQETKHSESELVTFTPSKQSADAPNSAAFHGHFDLTIASMQESGMLSERASMFQSSERSFSISFDLLGYLSEGLTEEDEAGLQDVFGGDVFEEFQDSFFGLLEGEEGLDAFDQELDDLFGKASEILDLEDHFFEDVKTMFFHSALMFTDQIEQQQEDEEQTPSIENMPGLIRDHTASMLEDIGILHTLVGESEKGIHRFKDGLLLNPSSSIYDRLSNFLGQNSVYTLPDERDKQLAKTLQSLQRQARNVEKILNR